ncbi:hypothetical protein [Capnocytophaga leadbetteri]|uniref:hypothetical protein n=1 Tax=Capnocytophaga leadbetteri TaxID=327575 RepID=UPI0028D6ECDF|nr:hypothetical protein [Capnocytophaga leadbetteri]
MKRNISIILSGAAFIFALLTFCITKTNFILPQIDTNSFLVSVLSVLVTILIGWQIYTAIRIDELIEVEVNKVQEKFLKETNDKILIVGFEFYTVIYNYSKLSDELILQLRDLVCILFYGSHIHNIQEFLPENEKNILETYSNELINLCDRKKNEIERLSEDEKEMLLRIMRISQNNIKGFNILKTILGDF